METWHLAALLEAVAVSQQEVAAETACHCFAMELLASMDLVNPIEHEPIEEG